MNASVDISEISEKFNITESDMKCLSTPNEKSFQLLRSNSDPEMPWLPFVIGQTTSSIWYWCTDQV